MGTEGPRWHSGLHRQGGGARPCGGRGERAPPREPAAPPPPATGKASPKPRRAPAAPHPPRSVACLSSSRRYAFRRLSARRHPWGGALAARPASRASAGPPSSLRRPPAPGAERPGRKRTATRRCRRAPRARSVAAVIAARRSPRWRRGRLRRRRRRPPPSAAPLSLQHREARHWRKPSRPRSLAAAPGALAAALAGGDGGGLRVTGRSVVLLVLGAAPGYVPTLEAQG
mmetsp:Transcript_53909/g.163158  ORF Transcript_53909/g.163158 Transcript_53909/m.163158 type:complete len:229 (+) Transcript_53909:79-765(+)